MVPATFKAVWNTNETLFTLMMNYVAIQLTSYFVAAWENPVGSNTVGVINQQTRDGWFPALFGQEYGLNVLLVLLLTVGMFLYLKYSKQGYEISVVGDSENTARYAGINVKKVTIRTMPSPAPSAVWRASSPWPAPATPSPPPPPADVASPPSSWPAGSVQHLCDDPDLLPAGVSAEGAIQIASQFNLNDYASNIITGIILFFIIGCEFFINYKVQFRSSGKKEA